MPTRSMGSHWESDLPRMSDADCVALFPNRSDVLEVFREDGPGVKSRGGFRRAHAD